MQSEEPVPSYPEYIAWAQDKLGVRVHSNIVVEDMPPPYYRGVVARSRIPAGKPLVSVPLGSLLSIQTMDGHPIESIMEKYEELELREDDMLALMLLFEKHIAVSWPDAARLATPLPARSARTPHRTGPRLTLEQARVPAAQELRHRALLHRG